MNTYETYVSLETAKLLKQAGFDWEEHYPRNFCYVNDSLELFDMSVLKNYTEEDDVIYLAPTLAVAQRWLIEKNLLLYICPLHINKKWLWRYWFVNCIEKEDTIQTYSSEEYKTYEEALEAGINKCLSLILTEE